ncbi:MAG: four helix bundle protein [Bdellovibrionota bacterium]
MTKNFLAYELAIQLYKHCEQIKAKSYIKDQLNRAALSIVCNLAEGSGKPTIPEKRRFYSIALGSLRETEALLRVLEKEQALILSDRLGGMLYRLVHPK